MVHLKSKVKESKKKEIFGGRLFFFLLITRFFRDVFKADWAVGE